MIDRFNSLPDKQMLTIKVPALDAPVVSLASSSIPIDEDCWLRNSTDNKIESSFRHNFELSLILSGRRQQFWSWQRKLSSGQRKRSRSRSCQNQPRFSSRRLAWLWPSPLILLWTLCTSRHVLCHLMLQPEVSGYAPGQGTLAPIQS